MVLPSASECEKNAKRAGQLWDWTTVKAVKCGQVVADAIVVFNALWDPSYIRCM